MVVVKFGDDLHASCAASSLVVLVGCCLSLVKCLW